MSENKSAEMLSVIITAHGEGILLHKTLLSIRRALEPLHDAGISTQLIIHCDNPSVATREYLKANIESLRDCQILTNSFKDLGESRNFSVQHAKGKYITFIDADDLMSREWLLRAYNFLEAHPFGQFVAHSETTIEFEGQDAIVIKHGEIDQPTDTLLSVYANRWNSIIMAPRELLLSEPYTANSPGFGYEDWHLNCRLIGKGIHNVLIPETAIFVRRKDKASEWLRQQQARAVLPKNPIFTFKNIRSLENTIQIQSAQPLRSNTKSTAVKIARKLPAGEKLARTFYSKAKQLRGSLPAHQPKLLPEWLANEWSAIHAVERNIFLRDDLRARPPYYDSLTAEHYQTGTAYKQLVDRTKHDSYDYLLFVPWLKHGGADRFSFNYANTITRLRPKARVAVITTLPTDSPWKTQLDATADFIPFGEITQGLSLDVRYRLLEQFIENSGAQYLHIINSELAYDFIRDHAVYITATNKKVIVSSFSQSTDETGRVYGYSHTHVPVVYDLTALITTDNQAVVNMWTRDYGFDPSKLLVHHQPVELPKLTTKESDNEGLRVLWAARLCPEKLPEIVAKIGHLLDSSIRIDMYGTIDEGFDTSFLNSLPNNVNYKGGFDGFYTLPLAEYDAYLYTSLYDGMPNAVLEAAAARLPIVSSAVGGIPNFITDNQDGLLIHRTEDTQAYANALKHLSEHPAERTKFSDHLYAKLRSDFSDESYEKQVGEFLKKLGL